MQTRWIVSLVCLILLGCALVADAQYHPGAANPPNQFQVIRSVGQASDETQNLNNFAYQSEIWLNIQAPINIGNDNQIRDFGVDVSPITTVASKFYCSDVNGVACGTGNAGAQYPTVLSPASGNVGTYDLYIRSYVNTDGTGGGQNIQQNTSYTFSAFSVTNYGEGSRVSTGAVRVAWKGTPKAPQGLYANFLTSTSFVLNWAPPQDIGQGKPTAGGYTLNTSVDGSGNLNGAYEVQIRIPTATGANLAWYSQDNSITANNWHPNTPFTTNEFSVLQTYVVGSTITILTPLTTYQVRVRAIGQFGRGIWSAPLNVKTWESTQTPNALVNSPTLISAASNGGFFTFVTNTSASGSVNNIIGGTGSGSAVSGFQVDWSCQSLALTSNTCPSGSNLWNTTSASVSVLSTNGRVSGGSVVIGDITYVSTAANYFVRVAAFNSTLAKAVGTFAGTANWTLFTLAGNLSSPAFAAAGGIGGATTGGFWLSNCWGTGAAGASTSNVACQGMLIPPAIIGGGGFKSYALTYPNASTISGAALASTDAAAFAFTTYSFFISSFTFAGGAATATNQVTLTVTNNTGTTPTLVSNYSTVVNESVASVNVAQAGNSPGTPIFVTRSGAGDTNNNSYLLIGKGTEAVGWGAVRVQRLFTAALPGGNTTGGAPSSGWNASNTGSAPGNLTLTMSVVGASVGTVISVTKTGAGAGYSAVPACAVAAAPAGGTNATTTPTITAAGISGFVVGAANNSGCTALATCAALAGGAGTGGAAGTVLMTGTTANTAANTVAGSTGCSVLPKVTVASAGATSLPTPTATVAPLTITVNGGTGYTANDVAVVTLAGTDACTTAFKVTFVTVTGGVPNSGAATLVGGKCTFANNTTSWTTLAVTGGTGTGATITINTVGVDQVTVTAGSGIVTAAIASWATGSGNNTGCAGTTTLTLPLTATSIASVAVGTAGTGYADSTSTTSTCTCTGGAGNVTATAYIQTTLNTIVVNNAGAGYTNAAPTVTCTGGQATGAPVPSTQATVTAVVTTAPITSVNFPIAGSSAAASAIMDNIVVFSLGSNQPVSGNFKVTVTATANSAGNTTAAAATTASSATTFATGALASTTAPNSMNVVDISDTAAILTLGFADTAYSGPADLYSSSATFAIKYQMSTPWAIGTYATPVACSAVGSTAANNLFLSSYNCQLTASIPGRQQAVQVALVATTSGTATASTYGNTVTFYGASVRSTIPVRNPSKGGASSTLPVSSTPGYYYATTTGFTFYYQPSGNVDSTSKQTVGGVASQAGTVSSWAVSVAFGSSQRDQWVAAANVNGGAGAVSNGSWYGLPITSAATGGTQTPAWSLPVIQNNTGVTPSVGYVYAVSVYVQNAINLTAADISSSVTTSASGSNPAVGAPKFGTAIRHVTDTNAWLEWEAPSDIGVAGAGWTFAGTCGSTTPTITASAVSAGSINQSNFMLGAVTGLSTSSCSVTIAYNNGQTVAGLTAATTSITVALAAASSTADAPATPTFDQLTNLSVAVLLAYPQFSSKAGAYQANQSFIASVIADFSITPPSGTSVTLATANIDTAVGVAATPNYLLNNTGINFQSGYVIRVLSYTTGTGGTAVTTALSQNLNFGFSVVARGGTGQGTQGSASTAGTITTTVQGDIPDAPTGISINRITGTSVRLSFTRPINVGGSPLSTTSVATPQVTSLYRVWYQASGAATYTAVSVSPSVGNNLVPATQPNNTWTQTWFIDVPSGTLTASTSYTFYVAATNQFSVALSGNGAYDPSVAGNALLAKLSTGVSASTNASGSVVPNVVTSLNVASFSNAYVNLTFNEPVNMGSSIVTSFAVTRVVSGSSATPTAVSCNGSATLSLSATAPTTVISCQDYGVSANTSYTYAVTAVSSNGTSTAANTSASSDAVNTAPGAPSAPRVYYYWDTVTGVAWTVPQDQGGVASSGSNTELDNFSGAKLQQAFVPATGEPSASACTLTYTWTTAGIGTGNGQILTFAARTIPGKNYNYSAAWLNQYTPTGATSPTVNIGGYSSTIGQQANSIQRPFPNPVITATTNGAGYVTFSLSYPTINYAGSLLTLPVLVSGTNANIPSSFVGLQIEQQTPTANVSGSVFTPDTFYMVASGGIQAAGATFSVNGLMAASRYRFKALAVNGFKNSEQVTADITVTTKAATAPGAVNTLSSVLQLKRNTSITLIWGAPLETGGKGQLNTYKVQYTTTGQAAVTNTTVFNPTTNYAIQYGYMMNGLSFGTAGTAYTISVWGSNGLESANPPASSFITGAATGNGASNSVTTGQIPALPTGLAASANATSSVTLTWAAPAAGSSALTGYLLSTETVTNTGATGAAVTTVSLATPPTTTYSVATGVLYRFQVSGVNAVASTQGGTTFGGDYSTPVITQASVATPVPNTVPTQLAGLTLTFYSANEYRVSWTDSNPTATASSYYVLAYWLVANRVLYSSPNVPGNMILNENEDLNAQIIGQVTTNNIASIATCTQIVYAIMPSSMYYLTVTGSDANGNLGVFTALPGTANAYKPIQNQGSTPGPASAVTQATLPSGFNTNTAFAITWVPPAYTGLGTIVSYNMVTSPEYGGTQIFLNINVAQQTSSRYGYGSCNASNTSCTALQANLQPGTNYIVNIRAVNSYGQSIPSSNLRITTTGGAGFSAQTSFWTLVLMAVASILAFAF